MIYVVIRVTILLLLMAGAIIGAYLMAFDRPFLGITTQVVVIAIYVTVMVLLREQMREHNVWL